MLYYVSLPWTCEVFCPLIFSKGCAMLQAGRSRVRIPMTSLNVFKLPNTSRRAMGLGFYSASNRNKYEKIFRSVKRSRRVRLTILPPFVSRLSRQREIFNISQHYRPTWPVTGIALLFAFTVLRYFL
jgi:hypothetical protein